MTFSDNDKGYKALVRRVIGMKPVTLRVGILEKDGGNQHGDDPVSVLMVGIWNEFGTATIPERSFIRAWFDANEDKLRAELVVLMRSVIAGKATRDQILNQLAQRAVGQIQANMATGVPPPNAPSTIARKGSSTPLIDQGILRSSISYDIQEGK